MILGSDGRIYGTAAVGGPATCGPGCTTQDAGMVYRIDANGANFTILKSFSTNPGDAYTPGGRLLEINGALFGTLQNGGAHSGGAVFRIDSSGAFSLVHEFDPAIDGSVPISGLTQGSDGLLYGTTNTGGQQNGGTAFRMDTSGGAFEVLHAFDLSNPLDAAAPQSALVQVGPSVFMGTTPAGGLFGNGTVYKLDVSTSPPTVVVLRSFEACCPSSFGSGPIPDLVKGAGGWVYGMTSFGGPTDFGGTIFGITPNGTIRLLHQFGFSEGSGPIGMTIADDGSFYGTTRYGGLNWGGILFRLRVDADGDGVRDPVDNCPTAANPAQIDTDGDGIGDGCPPDGPQAHVAKLTLGTLQFTYDGTPKATTVTATPIEALQTGVLTVTYNGSTTPPTNAGLYTVVASLVNPNYSTADVSAFMVIQQAPSIVTWNTPAHIFNPTPLSATQLNATANVPGTFVYMPDIGTVLPIGNNQQLTVAFTPNDSVELHQRIGVGDDRRQRLHRSRHHAAGRHGAQRHQRPRDSSDRRRRKRCLLPVHRHAAAHAGRVPRRCNRDRRPESAGPAADRVAQLPDQRVDRPRCRRGHGLPSRHQRELRLLPLPRRRRQHRFGNGAGARVPRNGRTSGIEPACPCTGSHGFANGRQPRVRRRGHGRGYCRCVLSEKPGHHDRRRLPL